jgi:hypothetical protein
VIERTEETLGERVARAVARGLAVRAPAQQWLALLGPMLERVASLPVPRDRFARVEPTLEAGDGMDDELGNEGEELPAAIAAVLRRVAGPAAGRIRLHEDAEADRLARKQRADAVTIGDDVYVRSGRFRPDSRKSIALLAHEAVHVASGAQADAAVRRSSDEGVRQEERVALQIEGAVLAGRPAERSWSPAVAVPSAPPVLAAREDRLDALESELRGFQQPDITALRRDLHRELLQQIRTDFERGG